MKFIKQLYRRIHRPFRHGFWHHNFTFLPYNSMYATITILLTSFIGMIVVNILAPAISKINNPWANFVSLVIIIPSSYLLANSLTNVFFYTRHPKMNLDQYLQFMSWNQIDKVITMTWRHHHKIIVVINPKYKSGATIKKDLMLIHQHCQNHPEITKIQLFQNSDRKTHLKLKLLHIFNRAEL